MMHSCLPLLLYINLFRFHGPAAIASGENGSTGFGTQDIIQERRRQKAMKVCTHLYII